MTQLRIPSKTFAATAVLLLAALAPSPAHAQTTCSATSDCEQGFECTVVGTSGCASAAPACPPDAPCDPPAPEPCETTVEKACTPARCTMDADCAAGMVCHAWEVPCAVSDCACSSDMPDCGCDPSPVCEPESLSMCTPRYLLPCQQAADCGSGFTCEQQPAPCTCAGGAEGRPAPDPGAPGFAPPEGMAGAPSGGDPVPNPDPCTCEPSDVFACVAQEIACTTAAECPVGWVCEQEPQPAQPGCAGDGCPEPEPLPPARSLCRPEYYGGGIGSGGGVDVGLPGVPASDPAPVKGGTGTSTPESGNNDTTDGGEARDSSACQMGRAPASSGVLSLLVVLGAMLGLKRRRA